MKKIYIILILSLGLITNLSMAQDIDPTVNVTRLYKVKLIESNKPNFTMDIPDSLVDFKLQFDYSIFDTPYKGAYEFKPYLLNIKPSSAYDSEKKLYLNVGAGYSLYPELNFVYSPKIWNRFRFSVFAHHNSYFGKYRGVGIFNNDSDNIIDISKERGYKGYRSASTVGANGSYDSKNGLLLFDLAYIGIAAKDTNMVRSNDGANMNLRFISKEDGKDWFSYDAKLSYSYFRDKMDFEVIPRNILNEHKLTYFMELGYSFKYPQKVLLDIDMEFYKYTSYLDDFLGNVSLSPNYEYKKDRWNLDLGLEFVVFAKNNNPILNDIRWQVIYPDIKANYAIIKDHLNLFLNATGGNSVNSYSSFVNENNHFTPLYAMSDNSFIENTVETINISLGINGNIATKFKYILKGGFVNFANAPVYALSARRTGDLQPNIDLYPLLNYSSYEMTFADLAFKWNSQDLDLVGEFTYKNTDLLNSSKSVGFAPSAFTTSLSATYNWSKRIYLGLDCDYSSSRKGRVYTDVADASFPIYELPYFVDLGLRAEYMYNNSISFWLRGSNLLNMPIIYNPAIVENGINFTIGFCYNL